MRPDPKRPRRQPAPPVAVSDELAYESERRLQLGRQAEGAAAAPRGVQRLQRCPPKAICRPRQGKAVERVRGLAVRVRLPNQPPSETSAAICLPTAPPARQRRHASYAKRTGIPTGAVATDQPAAADRRTQLTVPLPALYGHFLLHTLIHDCSASYSAMPRRFECR